MQSAGNKLCSAMEKSGITNPNSKEGIKFCTERCPYPECNVNI